MSILLSGSEAFSASNHPVFNIAKDVIAA